MLLHQVYHHYLLVLREKVFEVALEDVLGESLGSLDGDGVVEALLLLLPEERNAASDLHEAVHVLLIGDDQLTLHEVSHV